MSRNTNQNYKKTDSIITQDVFFILEVIENHHHRAMVVGGAVRNFLMQVDISDIDIATTATPREIMDIFKAYKLKVIPSGVAYGTVTIVLNQKPYEITTLRRDVKNFGRKSEVEFTDSFEQDSTRRDFTINAIYMNKNGEIFDYQNGINDIQSNGIRFIGDPAARIQEDYLRIFRYFRFVSYYGKYKCNAEYLSVINSLKKKIFILSSQRIMSELLKIFGLDDSYRIIPEMRQILDELFDLKTDPLKICAQLQLGFASASERFSMLLKFSKLSPEELVSKYKFNRNIKRLLLQKCDSLDVENIKLQIKLARYENREFFVKYAVIKMYADKIISDLDAKNTKKILDDFCNSEYANFNFKASQLSKFNLGEDKIENIMKQTKDFWTKSANVSLDDCIAFAEKLIT